MKRVIGLALLLVFPLFANAEGRPKTPPEPTVTSSPLTPTNYIEGIAYQRLSQPVRTADPSRIEVAEVFWYGCPHCFHFEPMLKEWQRKLPADVAFVHQPVVYEVEATNPDTGKVEMTPHAIHAQAFYTAQALGVTDRFHDALFSTINIDRKMLLKEDDLAAFFVGLGVKDADFRNAFNSFAVKGNVKQAFARTRGYRITGTPEMVVNGKYTVTVNAGGGFEEMLRVVDFLVAKERATRASAPK